MQNTASPLQVTYRPDLNILFCRWIDPSNSVQLQTSYLEALEKAKELKVNYWLFDLRRRGPACPADEAWLLQQFFPLVETSILGKQYFAYLVTPSHYLHIQQEIGMANIQRFSIRTKIYIFDSEQKAIDWLATWR